MADYEHFESVQQKGGPKPFVLRARRLWVDTPVQTPAGRRMGFAGMWELISPDGKQAWLSPDDLFREGFRPVTTAAEVIWLENPGKGLHPVWPLQPGEEPPEAA